MPSGKVNGVLDGLVTDSNNGFCGLSDAGLRYSVKPFEYRHGQTQILDARP